MICVPSILLGSELVGGMSFIMALVAGILGYLLIVGVSLLQGSQSSDLGVPTVVAAKPAFGSGSSNQLFSLVITISLIGWYGVQASVAGLSIKELFALINVDISLAIAIVIISAIMLYNAVRGFKSMEVINKITVPLLVIVVGWATINAISGTNLENILSYQPMAGNEISLFSGISISFGSFVVGAVLAGDYTRYNKNRKDTIKSAVVGIAPAGILLVICGALLAVTSVADADITQVLTSHVPIPAIALLTLIVATWTTNVTNAYSAGIAVVNGLGLKDSSRAKATLIAGTIGTLLAILGILDNFTTFLTILTTLVAPIGGIMVADYWILNKGRKEKHMEQVASKWVGVAAWIVGSIPGLLVVLPQFTPAFIANNAFLTSLCSMIAGS